MNEGDKEHDIDLLDIEEEEKPRKQEEVLVEIAKA